ncbi:MAG: RNA-binding protein [Candidatus Cloacimonetes bacterium]|nr:RNA-binding protein [Candidatus Cloacimonadota bacterium]MBL7149631.1 RNA-binding protein [Candidatus Cloacimonadota bacterium]
MQIYVGNIFSNISEDDLRRVFEKYGKVTSIKIVTDGLSHPEKECGYVEMPVLAEAEFAVSKLHHSMLLGNTLQVNFARSGLRDRRKNDRKGGRRDYDNQ